MNDEGVALKEKQSMNNQTSKDQTIWKLILDNTEINIDKVTALDFMRKYADCHTSEELKSIYNNKPGSHPGIEEGIGNLLFTRFVEESQAMVYFAKGSALGLNPKNIITNSFSAMCVGGCHAWLLNSCSSLSNENDTAWKLYTQAYLYLSTAIDEYSMQPYPFEVRMNLLRDNQNFSHSIRPFGQLIIGPQIIADAITLYMIFRSSDIAKANEYLSIAKSEHSDLDCITVDGQEADEYSLGELAKIGLRRHIESRKICEDKNANNELVLSLNDFIKIMQTMYPQA